MKEVRYNELVKDSNFIDRVFQDFVAAFMRDFMPGGPMGMLETSDMERWEILAPPRYEVLELPETGEDSHVLYGIYDVEEEKWVEEGEEDFPIYEDETVEIDGIGAAAWADEDEAEENATYLSEKRFFTISYGFPWANNWWFRPDTRISIEELQSAGFVVAYYIGGDGGKYTLCGIDGGGYDFVVAHYAPLCAIVHERRGWLVETEQGKVLVTTETRSDLKQLADAVKEGSR